MNVEERVDNMEESNVAFTQELILKDPEFGQCFEISIFDVVEQWMFFY